MLNTWVKRLEFEKPKRVRRSLRKNLVLFGVVAERARQASLHAVGIFFPHLRGDFRDMHRLTGFCENVPDLFEVASGTQCHRRTVTVGRVFSARS
jgi:hypothetical protein